MTDCNEEIRSLLDQANIIAIAEMKRLAIKAMKKHTSYNRFVSGMGFAFFVTNRGEMIEWLELPGELQDFISEWDRDLKLTGNQITIHRSEIG